MYVEEVDVMSANTKRDERDQQPQQFGDRGVAQLLFGNDPVMASAMVAGVPSGLASIIELSRPNDPQ
jgi:hypothetical protein